MSDLEAHSCSICCLEMAHDAMLFCGRIARNVTNQRLPSWIEVQHLSSMMTIFEAAGLG